MGRKVNKRRGRVRGGTVIRPGGKVGPQIVESRGPRWTDAHAQRFFDELGAHCNVTRAARAVGFSTVALYARRNNDPGFAERWQVALAQGYVRIELALVQRAGETLTGATPDPALPVAPMTVAEALALLKMHKARVTGEGATRGRRPRPRTLDEVRASIAAKLEAIEVARRAGDHG